MAGVLEEARWRTDRDRRRARNGSNQNTADFWSGTSNLEQVSAMDAIWRDGAEYYVGGPACGIVMECFTGVNFDFGLITLGHTVWSGLKDREGNYVRTIRGRLQAHEYRHVLDVETMGAGAFYYAYGWGAPAGMLRNPADGWHDGNPFEERGIAAGDHYTATGELPFGHDMDVYGIVGEAGADGVGNVARGFLCVISFGHSCPQFAG